MRRNRIIWGVLFILSLVGISLFGGAVTYGFLVLLLIIPFISLLYLLYVYFFFHMYQKADSKWLVANTPVPFYFTLINDYPVLFAGIRVGFYEDFSTIQGLSDEIEYEFLPHEGVTKETELICKYRGEYEVGIDRVYIQDFFRLFTISYMNREPLRVNVRPQMITPDELKNVDISSSMKDSFTDDSEPDILVKKYIPGDDIRMAHWGSSAKTCELMIRQRTGEQEETIGVVLDSERITEDIQKYIPAENKVLETVLAVSMYFATKKIPVSYFCNEHSFPTRSITDIKEMDEFYDHISDVHFDSVNNDEFIEFLCRDHRLFRCKTVFFVVQEITPFHAKLLWLLSNQNIVSRVYVISNELSPNNASLNIPRTEVVPVKPSDNLLEVL